MTTQTREIPYNSPVKSCRTCAHCIRDFTFGTDFDHCGRFKHYCSTSIAMDHLCGRELSEWKAKPPRRGLFRWLYDLFFA